MGKKEKNVSIVNVGMTVEGTIRCEGQLVINGTLKGNLEGETIIIGETGIVNAETKSKRMTIGGQYEGEIVAEQDLTILPTGTLTGKASCRNIVVEPGGILNATISRIGATNQGQAQAPEKQKKSS